MADIDICLVADPRFGGGTSTALMNEIRAIRQCGLSLAIAFSEAPLLGRGRTPHQGLLELIAHEKLDILPSHADCHAQLLLVHHPGLCMRPVARRAALKGDRVALVAHHPSIDRDGKVLYDYSVAVRNCAEIYGQVPVVLPVGPLVRDSFHAALPDLPLHTSDWPNLIDLDAFEQLPDRLLGDRLIVGRHTRPDPLKWPDPALAQIVYCERHDVEYRMLGVDESIRAMYPVWPRNWQALPFRAGGVSRFLSGLDAYCYFHNSRWTEAFGYNVLEALATGLPTILPRSFQRTFGEGPLFTAPEDVAGIYDRLLKDDAFRQESGHAARVAAERFGLEGFGKRVAPLLGNGSRAKGRARPPRWPDRHLVITSNGTGAGHISRQIAIARAAGSDVQTVFFTLSKAVRFARQAGFLAEYRPFHKTLGMEQDTWNLWFSQQVSEALQFYRPQAVIFDGNTPYRGLLAALDERPDVAKIWVRRGMWRRPADSADDRNHAFDLIIAPGELAASADPGHAAADGLPFSAVAPILSNSNQPVFKRDTARRLLGLPATGDIVLLALGSESNYDMSEARRLCLQVFAGTTVVELFNPLRPRRSPEGPHHLLRSVFPLASYLAAFDAAVLAAGYNLFHEAIRATLPTLFVPNTAAEMDLQETRADHAARQGWALSARGHDPYALKRGLRALGMKACRDELRSACEAIEADWDGASQAARLIAMTARRNPAVRG